MNYNGVIIRNNVLVATGSALFFYGTNQILKKNSCISSKVYQEKRNLWYNVFVSLLHSSLASVLCFICFYIEPSIFMKMNSPLYSDVARFATNVSVGYFLYDFVDNVRHYPFSANWPLQIHHVIIVMEYVSIGWYLGLYYYVIISLTCEINSIFLHLRQLFHLSKMNQNSFIYKSNKHANLITYLMTRMIVIPWMFIRGNFYGQFPKGYILTYGSIGTCLMYVINVFLLWKIVKKDYFGVYFEKQKRN